MTESVLAPIEPVAPRMVIARGAVADRGALGAVAGAAHH